MLPWNFRTYLSPTGRNDVQKEVDGYDDYARSFFSREIEHLAVTTKTQWTEPAVKKLKNEVKAKDFEEPLYEIRYKANNRSTRALGYFAPDGGTFVIVLICYHKGNVYTPADAFLSAHKRIGQIKKGIASTVPLQIDGENFPAHEEEPDSA